MLNTPLFRALNKLYGAEVTNEGESGTYERKVTLKPNGDQYVNYVVVPGGGYGEQYRMNCPFCSDDRRRYYVTYLFGIRDPESGRRNYGNTRCFNTECQTEFSNLRDLYDEVKLAGLDEYSASQPDVTFSAESSTFDSLMGVAARPGLCIPLLDIPVTDTGYAAVRYLRDTRGFDIEMLARHYGVEFLQTSYTYRSLSGRIFTPFYRDGVMVAWTARVVPGLCESDIPHWHSAGGLGGLLYGLGGAMRSRVAVVVEGPADRWAIGRPGVALLSKSLGSQKLGRLLAGLHNSSVEAVVILLDPDQPEKERHRPHQIKVATETLRSRWGGLVLPVYLPQGQNRDPGNSEAAYLAHYLSLMLSSYGYPELGSVLAGDVLASSAARGRHRPASQDAR